jgi:hypothetical protein
VSRPLTLHAPERPSASDPRDLVVEGGIVQVEVPLRRGSATLRLRRIAGRWLATATGPEGAVELGADGSPYLAAGIALERWQPDLLKVMLAVGSAVGGRGEPVG